MKRWIAIAWGLFATVCFAQEKEYRFRLASLFQPDRVDDFRTLIAEQFPEIQVVDVDFATAHTTLRFDVKQLQQKRILGSARTVEEVRTDLSAKLRGASRGVFDLLPLTDIPAEQVVETRIPVLGLDCKGCAYGAYKVVMRVEGVETASVDFANGEIRVRMDTTKTGLQAVEQALSQARIMTHYRIEDARMVPPGEMRIVRCSSEEPSRDEVYLHSTGLAANAIDGDPRTKWSSRYAGGEAAPLPHELVIDLGRTRKVAGFRYLPRQIGYKGLLAKTEFHVSHSADEFLDPPAAVADFTATKSVQSADCALPTEGRYVRVRVLSVLNGDALAAAADFAVIQAE